MKIAVDAMGGDYAPEEIVKGAVNGTRQYQTGIILVGPQDRIQAELSKYDTASLGIEIVHTDEYLVEGEAPAYALRTKRNASIIVATRLVKEGKADAVISMGPTGGVIASSLMYLGTLEGISRPVVGGPFCGFTPRTVTMDIGGNLDVKPDQLLDFAVVGTVYARKLLNIPEPAVALLNVGREEGKGNTVAKEAYPLLQKSGLNFIGNIEGNEVAAAKANVIICDGFTGNIMVKFCEGLGRTIAGWLTQELKDDLPAERIEEIAKKLLDLTVTADNTGGGPLWAVNGLVFKGHGRSRAPEVAVTIGSAKRYAELDIINALKTELAAVRRRLAAP
jgi:glycerol-3-phosphate acyltransferase PlsX